jgi:large subunit ribosomal protein L15
MKLNDVNKGIHKHKKRLRIGRGPGSGRGKTSGRGHKGQGQLAGWSANPIFEGARMPLVRRVPKRGFNNQWAREVVAVNLGRIEAAFDKSEAVTPESLRSKGLLKVRFELLKILGDGELKKPLKISAHRFSETALAKIQQAGGEAIVLPEPAPVQKNKMMAKEGNRP